MNFDFYELNNLRQNNPTWRLLSSQHAPLVLSFLKKTFITPNVRMISQAELVESLEDELYTLNEQSGPDTFPKSAQEYLNDWAASDKGWLRKFYLKDSDEVQFDLTSASEKAIGWVDTFYKQSFVGTESKLRTLFELLKEINRGSEEDPAIRIADLEKQKQAIDFQIAQIKDGNLDVLDDTGLKDRFMQFTQLARELLSDFREVEQNFRNLDRQVRERIAQWSGSKGDLLEEILGDRDAIADSDQGRSFRAFWGFLMSSQRQDQFSDMLQNVLDLPAIEKSNTDKRIRRIHYDWLEAGEHTQRTVAGLSTQFRKFLDDQAWLENRRIMDILQGIEKKAIQLRDDKKQPSDIKNFTSLEKTSADIELVFERPLYTPGLKSDYSQNEIELGQDQGDISALYAANPVDITLLVGNIHKALEIKSQVTLGELCEITPITLGLAELIGYWQLATHESSDYMFKAEINENLHEIIHWEPTPDSDEPTAEIRRARVPQIIFVR